MRVALTGVPGTGKTAIANALSKHGFEVIPLNEIVERKRLWVGVDEFGSKIVDMGKLERETKRAMRGKGRCIVEGHLACEMKLDCDVAIVCRTKPDVLERRLRERGYAERKVNENLMCELLDYCTILSLRNYRRVYEVRTDRSMRRSISDVMRILRGKGESLKAGWVRWRKELEEAAAKAE